MGKYRWDVVLRLCVCLWLTTGVCQTDCPYRECFCGQGFISCSDQHLQAMPQLVNKNASIQWSLDIGTNNISRIPGRSLPINLTDIDLDENPITTIDDTAFDDSANTLAALYFSSVLFTRFPDAFGHLHALKSLSISTANITDWNDGVWINIGQTLNSLDLENVGITVWPSWIRHCTQLRNLVIIWSTFTSIPDGALDSVAHSLTSLSLNNNKLTMVPKALSNLNFLETLYLEDNHITDVKWLPPQNNRLSTLSLSYNYISNASQLSEVLRPYSISLYDFGIDNNLLTRFPEISYLINVRSLDFTRNQISDPMSGAVAANVFMLDFYYNLLPYVPKMVSSLFMVTTISLSNNAIRAIRDTDFHINTTSIELGFNLITELTDTSFPENFRIWELDLNNNPLIRISPVALQNLPALSYLDLRYTKITRLPLGLRYLKSLVTLDVTNSTLLVCTCMESSLTSWVKQRNPENIHGNCGQSSVYDFFSILSAACPTSSETLS